MEVLNLIYMVFEHANFHSILTVLTQLEKLEHNYFL
jgi:hypothetical protein